MMMMILTFSQGLINTFKKMIFPKSVKRKRRSRGILRLSKLPLSLIINIPSSPWAIWISLEEKQCHNELKSLLKITK